MHPNAAAAVAWALERVGEPYLWGGTGEGGYDCSGLSLQAFAQIGVSIPRVSWQQFNATARVNVADLAPGDLVFFGSPIGHLGIYIGDGKMVEAPRTGLNIRVSKIGRRDLVGAGRVRWS